MAGIKQEIMTEKEVIRDEKGRFQEGSVGGPGRPFGSISIVGKIKKIFEERPEFFDEYVAEVLADPKLRAEIIRQIDGAPKQHLDLQADITNKNLDITDEQYERIIRERAAELGST